MKTIAQRAIASVGVDVFAERDALIEDLADGLPLLLKILQGRDQMLRRAEETARMRGWNGSGSLAEFILRLR